MRRASEADRDQVLGFASRTWHDWDYIPRAWPVWLRADDGAFLVGTVGEPGSADRLAGSVGLKGLVDAEGNALAIGQTVAITRVAMLSPDEAWLEGIRVDPRVRGMGVAADLQVAELHWVAAQQARVLRYATGASNEASHRLGARDGINLLVRFRAWWWSATGTADEDDDEPSAFDEDVREQATERRQAALARLRSAGLVVHADDERVADLWRLVDADPTFNAGERLYEPRPWALQELTEEMFRRHVERGEVIGGERAVAILVGEQLPAEDASVRLALLTGDGGAAAELADTMHRLTDEPMRFRVPADAPMIAGHQERFHDAGFVTPDWELHILARSMDEGHPIPDADPARVVLAEPPDRLIPPAWPAPGK